jgi:uncharacterized membrane protein
MADPHTRRSCLQGGTVGAVTGAHGGGPTEATS